jgi:hypothetical protein
MAFILAGFIYLVAAVAAAWPWLLQKKTIE